MAPHNDIESTSKDERDEVRDASLPPWSIVVALAITRALLVVVGQHSLQAPVLLPVSPLAVPVTALKFLFGEGVGTSHLLRSSLFFSVPQ